MDFIEFGEPQILHRVGDEYQAEVPELVGVADDKIRGYSLRNLIVGSPLKLKWISRNFVEGDCSLLVPGICDEQWSAVEKDIFLLGLYIFAKNFVELTKFVETKEMGALQSYYYGKFFSSPQHLTWSNIQRIKNKKGELHHRGIFSGVMLKQLLSRLLTRAGESQNALLEVSRSFQNKEISVAECMVSLKAMVGVEILVEVVGIDRGHQDLIAMALGYPKSNLVTNKFASLATAEIINILSGQHRLSKAKSSDLFWEAVWPRLLANGWHSEERTTYTHTAGSSCGLVFLVSGIKKFSRRKLVRGNHYFESPSDVLSKVSRELGLLELNCEEVGCSNEAEQEREGEYKENEESGCIRGKRKMDLHGSGEGEHSSHHTAPTTKRTRVLSSGGEEKTQESPPPREETKLLIDLNLPPQEVENVAEQSNPRRYSTRHRPPTTKVLDCFAHGYLTVNRRHKKKEK